MKTFRSAVVLAVFTASVIATHAQSWLTNGLIAYYPFNGNAQDASGNGYNGTPTDVTYGYNRFGQQFNAAIFNGTSSKIPVYGLASFNFLPVTLSVWVNGVPITGGDTGIICKYAVSSVNGYALFSYGDRVRSWYFGGSGSVYGINQGIYGLNTLNGNWHQIVVTYDFSGGVIYVDGAPVDSLAWSGSPAASTSTMPVIIGDYASADGTDNRFFNGSLDDIRIYNRALSSSEVAQLYASESGLFNVPGTSSPWLAGMPSGSAGGGGDTAPAESPVQATKIQVGPGVVFTFSASGGAFNFPSGGSIGPEGNLNDIYLVSPMNGMASVAAPKVALVGVFLDDNIPSGFSPPPGLDFSTAAARNFFALQPALRQPFFIGDGLTSGGVTQQFVAPAGATRLFLGIMDNVCSDNSGSFSVNVNYVPPDFPYRASATATTNNGFVVGVNVTAGGYGYTNTPLVRIIGGGGSGAQAVAVVSNGMVTVINVLNAGSGYTNAPLVVIDPPFVPNPVLNIAPMSFLSFSNLAVGGAYQLQQLAGWYWANQPVSFTATNGLYTQMVAGAWGSGDFRLALNPVPAQAFATPQVVNGFVVGATMTSGGSGYVTSPAVAIVGGRGTNATAVSHISGGVVTNISITSAGIGYTNTPTVQIAPPPAAAVSPTVLPVMRLDSSSLAPYDNYQIQFKPGILAAWGNWSNGLFAPTGVTNSQFLFITNGIGFFRLQYKP